MWRIWTWVVCRQLNVSWLLGLKYGRMCFEDRNKGCLYRKFSRVWSANRLKIASIIMNKEMKVKIGWKMPKCYPMRVVIYNIGQGSSNILLHITNINLETNGRDSDLNLKSKNYSFVSKTCNKVYRDRFHYSTFVWM